MLRRNVLIFQTGGLGDFVLTWPFAVALGRIYPQSRIIYVTHAQKGDLARRVLRLESTDVEAGWHGLFAEAGQLPPAAQSLLQNAHAIYTFLPVTSIWRANVNRISQGAKCVEIDARVPDGFPGHLTDRIAEGLTGHPPEQAALQQMLRSINDRGIGFKPIGGTGIVLHPGSGSRDKCWPLSNYMQLAERLKTAGKSVRFVIGEVELERWSQGDLRSLEHTAPLARCSTCIELLNEISTAAAFIGNDSGPAHLAGIIGVNTVSLFGPTYPANWKPLGPQVKVLQNQSMQDLSVEEVGNVVVRLLSGE